VYWRFGRKRVSGSVGALSRSEPIRPLS
jgi:hypothetical protein